MQQSSKMKFFSRLVCLVSVFSLSHQARAGSRTRPGVSVRVLQSSRVRVLRGRRLLYEGQVAAKLDGARVESISSFLYHKMPALRIRFVQPLGAVEMVLVLRAGRWELVWSGRTGSLGPDGEVIRRLETGPSRLLVSETHKGWQRCDKAPVRLFPRAFDPASWHMRPVSFRPDTKGIEVLHATLRPPNGLTWPAGLSAMRFLSASTRQGDGGRVEGLGRPRGIDDGDLSTVWAEARGGAGMGEFLDARSPAWPYDILGLVLVPGNASSPKALARDNRVARFLLTFEGGQRYVVDVPDSGSGGPFPPVFWVRFPKPVRARCATVVLLSAYQGTDRVAGGRTAISELHFLTSLDLRGGLQRLAADVASGRVDRALAISVVRGLGKAVVPRVRAALARSKGGAADFLAMAFLDLVPDRLGEIADRVTQLSRPVRRRFAQAAGRFAGARLLGRLFSEGTGQALGWLALESAWKLGRRHIAALAAARLLDRVSEETAEKLIGLLVSTEASELSQSALLGKNPSPRRIWTAGQRVLAGVAPAARTADLVLPLWKNNGAFRYRFRLVQVLGWSAAQSSGWTGAEALRSQVVGLLTSLVRRGREELLRWAAVRSAGATGLGVQTLRRLLADPAPRMRVAALRGLVRAGWAGRGRALLRCTLQDPWEWVRLSCSSMLGQVCPQGIGSVLAGQVQRYGLGATVDLATVLATCRYPEAWPLLRKLLAGYRKGPWKAARAARLLASAQRTETLGLMAAALKDATRRAKAQGPFERLALDLLGALDELTDSVRRQDSKVLWGAVAFALRKGATRRIQRQALDVVSKHCPKDWRSMLAGAIPGGIGEAARHLESLCGRGRKKP